MNVQAPYIPFSNKQHEMVTSIQAEHKIYMRPTHRAHVTGSSSAMHSGMGEGRTS